MTTQDINRARKKREQYARDKYVLSQIALLSQLACESHKNKKLVRKRLSRIVEYIAEISRDKPMNDERRKQLLQHIYTSSDAHETDIGVEDGQIVVNGHFYIDPKLLADKIIW